MWKFINVPKQQLSVMMLRYVELNKTKKVLKKFFNKHKIAALQYNRNIA